MSKLYIFFILLCVSLLGFRCDPELPDMENAPLILNEICDIISELDEISGIIRIEENRYIAHNDGGDEPRLYEFGSSCILMDDYILAGGINKDWEGITQDELFVYLGDFGNNFGSRTDLGVYKIAKDDFAKDSLDIDTYLLFNYSDQETYNSGNVHNFDCEAMISIDDHLLLFTKNRANLRTNVYQLNKSDIGQTISMVDDFDTEGLVTDAVYNEEKDQLILLCYNFVSSSGFTNHIWFINNYSEKGFATNNSQVYPINEGKQFESIVLENSNSMLIGHEVENGGIAKMYRVDISGY